MHSVHRALFEPCTVCGTGALTSVTIGGVAIGRRANSSGLYAAAQPWSRHTAEAMEALNAESLSYVLERSRENSKRRGGVPDKVDCNFYPCTEALDPMRPMLRIDSVLPRCTKLRQDTTLPRRVNARRLKPEPSWT